MERVNRILNHPVFLEKLAKNQAAEADRRFCRHGMEHFLDVARIGMILNLQENLQIRSRNGFTGRRFCMILESICSMKRGFPTKGQAVRLPLQSFWNVVFPKKKQK